jgi:hypothetical protein
MRELVSEDVAAGQDKFAMLKAAWENRELSFDQWLIELSAAYFNAGGNLKIAAIALDTRPAALQAALSLASLPEEDLALLAGHNPPPTTWFSLASASSDAIRAAISALENQNADYSPASIVDAVIRDLLGPNIYERISGLPSEAFSHAAKKAESYGLLNDKTRGALKGFHKSRTAGKTLTVKQIAYAKDLLDQLAQGGAIVRNSQDGDKELCDQILDALGI